MKTIRYIFGFLPIFIIGFLFVSCTKDDIETDNFETVRYGVAVVLPLSDAEQYASYKLLAEQFRQKLEKSQLGLAKRVVLDLEWYDEDTEDIVVLGDELAKRDDIIAVIGAQHSVDTQILAKSMSQKKKTLVSTESTSVELARSYAGKKFFWTLTETDVTQCELLLHLAKESYYTDKVSIVAPTDIYGQSFIDWAGFIATEMGMTIEGMYTYDPQKETSEAAYKEAFSKSQGLVICIPSDITDVTEAVTVRNEIIRNRFGSYLTPAQMYSMKPYIVFSDAANDNKVLSLPDSIREYIVGISVGTDPLSGFDIDYQARYGEPAKAADALFYDALLLVSLGLREYTDQMSLNLNEAIIDIVRTHDDQGRKLEKIICFDQSCLTRVIQDLANGTRRYDISGVSSSLDFDRDQQTSVVHSIYDEWCIYQGQFQTISKLSSDGSGRTENSLAAWNLKTSYQYDESFFNPDAADIAYSSKPTDSWALLIATSTGWSNFRHQADVLSVYHKLKAQGYPDDHIVLIMADDLASSRNNPHPGTIMSSDGKDLYKDVHIDYKLSELQPSDIGLILSGQKQDNLHDVIKADSTQNILVFWSGHGNQGFFCWDNYDYNNAFNRLQMEKVLDKMVKEKKYRKMLWLVEACYSASVADVTEEKSVPGVMMLTAANANETSKAFEFNSEYNTWMTNRFTMNLLQTLDENPSCSYLELYKGLTRQTTGSHVTIINNNAFGNLYKNSIEEFFKYNFK